MSGYNNDHDNGSREEENGREDSRYGQSYPPMNRKDEGGWPEESGGQQERENNTPYSGYKSLRRRQGYQYDPKTGWRQSGSDRPRDGYEWNFQDYDRLDRNRKRSGSGRNRGLIVFTVSLVGILVLSLFAITGYSIVVGMGDGREMFTSSEGTSAQESLVSPEQSAQSEAALELASKPQVHGAMPEGAGLLSIPEIAKLVSPSVVGVSAYQDGRFYEPVSVGSGIVMSADGYVVTNAHVVMGGTKYKVQLFDNTPFDAELVGADSNTDLAVLKIKVDDLTPAIFGDSDEIEVGETVVAIGNPSGIELAGSVTRGIISAVNRVVSTDSQQFNYIQTDAAINPGNSGGALVNEYGQVIGINSSKIVATGYEGIGFAIPITDAKPILDELIANGRVTGRVMLGIGCDIVTEADARKYGIPMGLEIREIYERSDMKNKDVQLGDILVEIDGNRVYTLTDVQGILKTHKVGDTVDLKLYRRISAVQSSEIEINVKLVEN